jgi:hypothetical protein
VSDISEAGIASGGASNITFISATQGWICDTALVIGVPPMAFIGAN